LPAAALEGRREAAKELAAAEADRATLIEMIDLHVIGPLRNPPL